MKQITTAKETISVIAGMAAGIVFGLIAPLPAGTALSYIFLIGGYPLVSILVYRAVHDYFLSKVKR